MKKVELLAPAGNYQAFVGALSAGADAVYLGGDKFGARAYADNFTGEEICRAIRYAHFFGKKIYLTVNTLVKEKEFSALYDYLSPFYEAGLDGVIIQDLGVFQYIRETFPKMALHASTQMTITGAMGALFLKEIGAARIVPARELSLPEIKRMKELSGLEMECFIHGAMCYCYSGQCLFSSILGGRSGNRGRCAQPCRLPYKVMEGDNTPAAEELYPLSLKDMCTIEYIPRLIEAGIDSFKIEGRMKKPEYAAGVTAVYRKYIDRYYEEYQEISGTEPWYVEKPDMDRLRNLYIRSEIQTGYYERTNGREMIALHKPGYVGSDEKLLQEITEQYIRKELKCPVTIEGTFRVNEPAVLRIEGAGTEQISYGAAPVRAEKRSMTKEDILKQLRKTGGTYVQAAAEKITVGKDVFIPVKQLNDLRREAVSAFENKVIAMRGFGQRSLLPRETKQGTERDRNTINDCFLMQQPQLHVTVQTMEQMKEICKYSCDRVYIDSDLYMENADRLGQYVEKSEKNAVFLALPYIIREKDISYLQELADLLQKSEEAGKKDCVKVKGFLVRNLESFYFVRSLGKEYEVVTDAGLYCFNAETLRFWHENGCECSLPYELNGRECGQLIKNTGQKLSMIVYGTIPMMLTANCLKKTTGTCLKNDSRNILYMQDRYKTDFPVLYDCRHCYNIIYNSVPYSLHHQWKAIRAAGLFAVRLDFVSETEDNVKRIMDFYTGKTDTFPITEYTTGHYKRGIS